MASKPPPYRLGIDLGGTKIHAVVIDRIGAVIGSARLPTKADKGYAKVIKRIAEAALGAADDAGIPFSKLGRVGLGVPGPVDREGNLLFAANLGWKKSPVAADVGARLQVGVVLGNDVNCGALGETTYGAAAGVASAAMFFVGTGLGGAVVVNGTILNGAHGFGGEFGHIPAPFGDAQCGCGNRGCLETVASKTGIVRLISEAVRRKIPCKLEAFAGGKIPVGGATVKSGELHRAFRAGCPATRAALNHASAGIAWGMQVIGNAIDPETYVLGGGVMQALGRDLVPLVRRQLKGSCALYRRVAPDLRLAKLGDDAVAIGAAVLAGSEA